MEGYKPSDKEIEKAESMVLPNQKKIDELLAEKDRIALELGIKDLKAFDYSNTGGSIATHEWIIMGTFNKDSLDVQKSEIIGDEAPDQYSGSLGGVPLPADIAQKLFQKFAPIIPAEKALKYAYGMSTQQMKENVKEEISTEVRKQLEDKLREFLV